MNLRKIAVVVIFLLAASACTGGGSDGDAASTTVGERRVGGIVFWTAEDNAVRVEATKDIAEALQLRRNPGQRCGDRRGSVSLKYLLRQPPMTCRSLRCYLARLRPFARRG